MQNAAMDLSSVPEAVGDNPCSRETRLKGKSERQGRTWRLIFWKRQRESGENPTQPNICRQVSCEKVEINVSRVWTTWVIGLVILNALEMETQNFTIWPNDQSFPDREDSRTIMVV